jgi:uncharacterized membrane protein YbaN (DUF454 family)
MLRQSQILLWRIVAVLSLTLGVIGLALPVLPTVPFIILAAFAGGKGWPALEGWLLEHRTYGPYIRTWRERGAVPRIAKVCATLMMLTSAIGLQFVALPVPVRVGVPIVMALVAIWLWRRPE